LNADAITPILAPDNSLQGVSDAIQGARVSIDIEQMNFDLPWRSEASGQSPLVDAVVAAARRGVKVRVLLNDDRVFLRKGETASSLRNPKTVQYFSDLAAKEHLPIEARIADVAAMGVGYIHNKGMLIDGHETLVSSINWGENSFLRNREAAVLIDSTAINAHYQGLFNSDWNVSSPGSSGNAPGNGQDGQPAIRRHVSWR
jgi:phosphatidylserine/phosphatidylglycerophosphate/cardiolipin synthase-like enzyme